MSRLKPLFFCVQGISCRQSLFSSVVAFNHNFSKNYTQNWQEQLEQNKKRRKIIPSLIYLHNPWKYIINKLKLLKLRLLWDKDFREDEFIRGSKQAAVVITDIIRTQSSDKIGQFTTPLGYQQITRDMLLSRNDSRLKLVKFETEHLIRAIPMKVITKKHFDQKYCFIDMLFVGLRNSKDFDTPEEAVEIKELLQKMDNDLRIPHHITQVKHRIVFAEIFMRFRRDYTEKEYVDGQIQHTGQWSVSFYKILSFDVLNYNPR